MICHLAIYRTPVVKVKLKPWPAARTDLMNQGWLLSRREWALQPLTEALFWGRWLHDWSLVATAADGWQIHSVHVFSSSGHHTERILDHKKRNQGRTPSLRFRNKFGLGRQMELGGLQLLIRTKRLCLGLRRRAWPPQQLHPHPKQAPRIC